jgi:hypothetical protein
MTVQQLGGYPGLRRNTPLTRSLSDLQVREPLIEEEVRAARAARDLRATEFATDLAIRRRLADASIEAAARRALARRALGIGLGEMFWPVTIGLVLYEVHDMFTPPGARDPMVEADYALSINVPYTYQDFRPATYRAVEIANGWPNTAGHPFYLVGVFAPGTHVPCTPPTHVYDDVKTDVLYTDFEDLPGVYPARTRIARFVHFDDSAQAIGDVDGADLHELWTVGRFGGPATVAFVNPSTGPATQFVGATPLPFPLTMTRTPNPFLSPWEQTQFGPGPVDRPLPWEPEALGGEVFDPLPSTVAVPAPILIGAPPSGPPVVAGEAPAEPAPREKERKVRLSRAGRPQAIFQARNLAGEVSEFLDSLKSFWYALPPQFRSGYKAYRRRDGTVGYRRAYRASIRQMIGDVYSHSDQLDMFALFKNVLRETVTDRVIGGAHQAFNRSGFYGGPTSRLYQNRPGLFAGPWDNFVASQASHFGH